VKSCGLILYSLEPIATPTPEKKLRQRRFFRFQFLKMSKRPAKLLAARHCSPMLRQMRHLPRARRTVPTSTAASRGKSRSRFLRCGDSRSAGAKSLPRSKKYIGRMTNNVAEYYGLIAAARLCASPHGHSCPVRGKSDSELLVAAKCRDATK